MTKMGSKSFSNGQRPQHQLEVSLPLRSRSTMEPAVCSDGERRPALFRQCESFGCALNAHAELARSIYLLRD
jgi:hypothetical protein